MGRGRVAIVRALALALLLLAPAAGLKGYLVAASIAESVDVLNFKHAQVTVDYDLSPSPEYVEDADERVLNGRFKAFPHTYATFSKQGSVLRFTMGEVPRIGFNAFRADEGTVEVELTLLYRPKQFELIPGVFSYGRRLRITYPSLTTLRVANLTDLPLETNFTLSGKLEPMTAFAPSATELEVGELIRVKRAGDGGQGLKFCIAAVSRRGETPVLARAVGSSCEQLAIPTEGSLDAVYYELHLIGVRADAIEYARHELRLAEPQLPVRLRASRTSLFLGERLMVDVDSPQGLEGCTVNVYDSFGIRKNALSLDACAQVAIGTATGWAPGPYIVEVEGHRRGVIGRATLRFELMGVGDALPTETVTDKGSYVAGEEVSLFADVAGDICRIQMFNRDNVAVIDTTSVGCGATTLRLDPSLEPGTYTVQTTPYRDNVALPPSTNGIEVGAWRPKPRTPQSEACEGGAMYALGARLPCIETGQTCVPASSDIPLCLCFDRDSGDAVDVCEYGRSCGRDSCAAVRVPSPFIIVRTEGECLAKSGLSTLSCIEVGEVCMGSCVCLDENATALSACGIGDVCGPDGCSPSRVEFSLTGMEPGHARADALSGEGVGVTWRGNLRFDGELLGEEARADLSVNASIGDRLAEEVSVQRLSGEAAAWSVTARFRSELEPGLYEAFLVLVYRGNTHVIRRPFEVWHDEGASRLAVDVKAVEPSQVRSRDFEPGFPLKLVASVQEAGLRSVADLPKEAFNLTFGGRAPTSMTPTYSVLSERWTVAATFSNTTPPEDQVVTLAVSHLGRRGEAQASLPVVDEVPLEFTIQQASPGNEREELIYYLVVMGFNLDIYLQLKGTTDVAERDIEVHLGESNVTRSISYVVGTTTGVRLHLTDVQLCPDPPPPGAPVDLRVDIHTPQGLRSRSTRLSVKANPGNYVTRCG